MPILLLRGSGGDGSGETTPDAGKLPLRLRPSTAVIQSRGAAVDANQAPVPDWTTVHSSARCRLTEMLMEESLQQSRDGRLATHWIDLDGDWTSIVPTDGRITISGRVFAVTGVTPIKTRDSVAYTAVACKETDG